MKVPQESSGTNVHLTFVDYAEGSTEAQAEIGQPTEEGQKAMEAARDELRAISQAMRDAEDQRDQCSRASSKAQAAFMVADSRCDATIMAVSGLVFNGPAHRDYNAPVYIQAFGTSRVSDLTKLPVREQPDAVDQVLIGLESIGDFPGKEDGIGQLRAANDYVKVKRDALAQAQAAETAAFRAVLAARQGVREALVRAHGILTAAYPGRRDFVEGLFYRPSKKKAAPASAPAASPENGAATSP